MDHHLFIRSYFFHPLQKQSAGLFWCGSHRHSTIFQNPLFIVPYRSTEFWGDPNHLFGDIWINATWKKTYAICVSVYRDIHVFCLLFWYTGCLKNRYPKIQSLITLVPKKKHVLIYWDRHPVFCLDLEWGTQNVIVGHHVLSWLIIMFHIKIAIWGYTLQ